MDQKKRNPQNSFSDDKNEDLDEKIENNSLRDKLLEKT
jgi:hypothetical protein